MRFITGSAACVYGMLLYRNQLFFFRCMQPGHLPVFLFFFSVFMLVERRASQPALRSAASDSCGFCSSTRRRGAFYTLGVAVGEEKVSCGLSNQCYLLVPLT